MLSLYNVYKARQRDLSRRYEFPDTLVASFQECEVCYQLSHFQPVAPIGAAPTKATLLVVGRNPGATEDESGVPFIGPSGEVLFDWLQQAKYDFNDIVLTNLFPAHTSSDRPLTDNEINHGKSHLRLLLGHLPRLRVLLLCGRQVTTALGLANSIISKAIVTKQGYFLVPSIHPGATLYAGSNDYRTQIQQLVTTLQRLQT